MSSPLTFKQAVAELYGADHKLSSSGEPFSSVSLLTPDGQRVEAHPMRLLQRLAQPGSITFLEFKDREFNVEGIYYQVPVSKLAEEFDVTQAQVVVRDDIECTKCTFVSPTRVKTERYYPAWATLREILYPTSLYTRLESIKLLTKMTQNPDVTQYLRALFKQSNYPSDVQRLVEYSELVAVVYEVLSKLPPIDATLVMLEEYIKLIDNTIYPTSYKNQLLPQRFAQLCGLRERLQPVVLTPLSAVASMALWDQVQALSPATPDFATAYLELVNKFPTHGSTILLLTAQKLAKRLAAQVASLDAAVYSRLAKLTKQLIRLMSQ